jgi:hypothetical protein
MIVLSDTNLHCCFFRSSPAYAYAVSDRYRFEVTAFQSPHLACGTSSVRQADLSLSYG